MSALSDYLDYWDRRTAPTEFFEGIVTHIDGAPDDNTSPFFMFAHDDTNDKTYINPDRTSGGWTEVADATAIAAGGTPLVAT